jgi:hypothetical protein
MRPASLVWSCFLKGVTSMLACHSLSRFWISASDSLKPFCAATASTIWDLVPTFSMPGERSRISASSRSVASWARWARAAPAGDSVASSVATATHRASCEQRILYEPSSRIKVTKAIEGRFEESRMANWIPSSFQPCEVHSLSVFSISSSVTVPSSTTLYTVRTVAPSARARYSVGAISLAA